MSRRLAVAIALPVVASLMFVGARTLWLDGFDSGSAAMQCVDGYSQLGKEWLNSNACKEAFAHSHSPTWKLFARHDSRVQ